MSSDTILTGHPWDSILTRENSFCILPLNTSKNELEKLLFRLISKRRGRVKVDLKKSFCLVVEFRNYDSWKYKYYYY